MTDDVNKLAGVEPPPEQSSGATLVSHNPAHDPDPLPGEPAPIVLPPANVDVPLVCQTGDVLDCTMGNWDNMQDEPHSYAYQWRREGIDMFNAVNHSIYVTPTDVGYTYDCVLTATNAAGSASVDSNAVVVIAV